MKPVWWMLGGLSAVAAVSTILPTRIMPFGATTECMLGYAAHCSFTPVSTVICVIIAGALFFIGGTNILDEKDGEENGKDGARGKDEEKDDDEMDDGEEDEEEENEGGRKKPYKKKIRCPKCRGMIVVKTPKRPLKIKCPKCGKEGNLPR